MIPGIDVSSNQGHIDWRRVRADGYRYALVRTIRSDGRTDDLAEANLIEARAVGMIVGPYGFYDCGAKMLGLCRSWLGTHDELLSMVDVELDETPEAGRTYLEHAYAAWGRRPVGYLPEWWMRSRGWTSDLPTGYPWMASNYSGGRTARTYQDWRSTFMQHSESASVPGIDGPVDASVFFGTIDQLAALAGGNDMSKADVTAALQEFFHARSIQVPQGKTGNDDWAATMMRMAQGRYNDVAEVKAALASILGHVGTSQDAILAALAAMHVTVPERDARRLASELPADDGKALAALQFIPSSVSQPTGPEPEEA